MNVRQLAAVATVMGAVVAATATGPVAAAAAPATTYANPVVSGLAANPAVLKSGSTYYAYVNGFDYFLPFPVMALSSTDLVTWTQVGNVLPPERAGAWLDASSGWRFSSPSARYIPGNPRPAGTSSTSPVPRPVPVESASGWPRPVLRRGRSPVRRRH